MLYWQGNSRDRLKKAILQRHEEYLKVCNIEIKENKKYASLWEIIHTIIGLIAVFSSSVSAVLTFYKQPLIVAVFAFLSTISAAFLTFLNPSKRAIKRRTAYVKFTIFENRVRNSKLKVETSMNSEQKMILDLEALNDEYGSLIQELLKLED
jgi:hypothetical protein